MEQVLVGRDKRKSSVSSTARPTVDPGGMVLRSFGNGRVWTDTCRMVELFGVVVVSTIGQARSTGQFLLWRWTDGRWQQQPLRVHQTGMEPCSGVWLGRVIRFRC